MLARKWFSRNISLVRKSSKGKYLEYPIGTSDECPACKSRKIEHKICSPGNRISIYKDSFFDFLFIEKRTAPCQIQGTHYHSGCHSCDFIWIVELNSEVETTVCKPAEE